MNAAGSAGGLSLPRKCVSPQLSTSFASPRYAIVGGGVAGLAAAHRLRQLMPAAEVRLLEAGPRLGGALDTRRSGALVLEQGADSFLTRDPVGVELCRELGLGDELLSTSRENRRALVVCRGRLAPVPNGFVLMQPRSLGGVLRSSVLSLAGKLRVLAEPWIRAPAASRGADDDESVASFATRRLGREAFERLVQPLLAGIYVADASELSLAATMPEFLAGEREHGSLRAAWRAKSNGVVESVGTSPPLPSPPHQGEGTGGDAGSGARYGDFVTLRNGVGSLVNALAASLPPGSVRLETPVTEVRALTDGRWSVTSAADADEFDGVILAAPAAKAAKMVRRLDAELSGLLARITAASSVVVTLVYRREQIARQLDGFGFVVPRIEHRLILAASFPSVKFAERGPTELTPVRVFLGGALDRDMIDRSDEELTAIAQRELGELIGARGEPRETTVARWRESMPQYQVGHLQIVRAIDERVASHQGLELAGNSYRGVGIPQCLRSGREAAERLASALHSVVAAGGASP